MTEHFTGSTQHSNSLPKLAFLWLRPFLALACAKKFGSCPTKFILSPSPSPPHMRRCPRSGCRILLGQGGRGPWAGGGAATGCVGSRPLQATGRAAPESSGCFPKPTVSPHLCLLDICISHAIHSIASQSCLSH